MVLFHFFQFIMFFVFLRLQITVYPRLLSWNSFSGKYLTCIFFPNNDLNNSMKLKMCLELYFKRIKRYVIYGWSNKYSNGSLTSSTLDGSVQIWVDQLSFKSHPPLESPRWLNLCKEHRQRPGFDRLRQIYKQQRGPERTTFVYPTTVRDYPTKGSIEILLIAIDYRPSPI